MDLLAAFLNNPSGQDWLFGIGLGLLCLGAAGALVWKMRGGGS